MKVYLGQDNTPGVGGITRVINGLYEHLPKFGIEIVKSVEEADVCHAHVALYDNIPVHMPLVVSSHGMLWTEDGWEQTGQKVNQMCIDAYMQADVVTVPSTFIRDTLARNLLLDPIIVRHGINLDEWTPQEPEKYVLWNKARLDPANNPEAVNKLAALAAGVQFVSTFGNPTNNVKIIGPQTSQDMKSIVQKAWVYLSTLKESGGPSFGVLEAMASGVPILSWNFGGTAEAIEHLQTGYLAEPGNYNDLLEGLKFCLANRQKLGENARSIVQQKYLWPNNIQGYINAYKKAIDAQKYELPVSVIVPCYNLSKFLPACIESIQKQSYTNWELIVVDDASTDNSYQLAEDAAKKDSRIKVIKNSTNMHVSESRNTAIEQSKGRYIIPLDADDRLAPDALYNLTRALDTQRSLHIVGGKLVLVQESDLTKGYINDWPEAGKVSALDHLSGHNKLPYCSMYRKTVWERVGGYRRRIKNGVEDADFWTRALSFGFSAEIIPDVTLYYTNRDNSLGKTNTEGISSWLRWFTWKDHPETAPFGAFPIWERSVSPYDVFDASIIIPVGPGHEPHLQGCVDSVWTQTAGKWEVIVVNDTGKRWFNGDESLTKYTAGMPFVRFVDSDRNRGVAWARNRGIEVARSNKIVFLDVDDVMQKDTLGALLQAHQIADGWIYGDWFAFEGTDPVYKEAPDWDAKSFIRKALAPITGIYWKKDLLTVGGFDEFAPGWEDWDMQLSLLERGICGTRVRYPLITYNMLLGQRREENFKRQEELLQFILNKHKELYTGAVNMGCGKCGGQPTINVGGAPNTINKTSLDEQVLMQYDGPKVQTQTFYSQVKRGVSYFYDNQKPFLVFKGDAELLEQHRFFHRVVMPLSVSVEMPVPLISKSVSLPIEKDGPIEQLNLKPEVVGILKTQFNSIAAIRKADNNQLLAIKGIGEARLTAIRKAIEQYAP